MGGICWGYKPHHSQIVWVSAPNFCGQHKAKYLVIIIKIKVKIQYLYNIYILGIVGLRLCSIPGSKLNKYNYYNVPAILLQ